MDHQSRDARPLSQRLRGLVSLSWAMGALASVVLAFGSLQLTLFLDAITTGTPWAYGFPALFLVQAALCLAGIVGWVYARPFVGAAAMVALIAADAGLWSIVWPNYSPVLWWPWIAPLPMVIPALIEVAALPIRRPHAP